MKILFVLCFSFVLLSASSKPRSNQLIVVSSANWSASSGVLQRYQYINKNWKKIGKQINIKLGRNGLGWGRGLHKTPSTGKIIKKEGDGKAPAGIFELKNAFGYAPLNIKYPYEVYGRNDHCVDDTKSKYYNKIINTKSTKKDYKSFEYMKLSNNYYKYGIVVNHNNITKGKKSKRGAGSCIFIHIKNRPTAGCTVMSQTEIKRILKWLNPNSNPLFVQGVKGYIPYLRKQIRSQ